ncbi:momilactone A synthase-like isoform X2 [Phragmites australis]|uniref:momilactone A synthase-like isoform X2 n=1 Tax=Phragmites australis TaxID=29695 RepID=UPI002D76BCB1|nr:momilactone A synthase-like isoform X2 [Phragmites australis]
MASNSQAPAAARKLEGKVAVITGGASGIGACTARLFVKHGASVVIADIQDELGASLCAELGPGASSYVHCDVTNEDDVAGAVDHAVAKFGKLDIMFNNAGIGGAPCFSIRESTKEDFERVLAVNLVGPFLGTKHAARVMVPARRGCIISTSSLASAVGGAAPHAYASSKRGLVGFTENAAGELGRHGIRVNCVAPAGVATPLARAATGMDLADESLEAIMEAAANLKGVGLKVDDIAAAVLFLASDDARYVSGQNLLVDGGVSVVNSTFGFFRD